VSFLPSASAAMLRMPGLGIVPAIAGVGWCREEARTISVAFRYRTRRGYRLDTHRRRGPCSANADASSRDFLDWCAGVGIKGDAVTVGLFPGKLRGLRAQRPIPAEDAVVRVPFSAALSLVPYDACPFPEVVAAATYASLAPEVKMALLLLHERGKKDSRYAPYLRMLPQRLDCPAVWSREELRLLRHPHVEAEAQRMAERWRAAYDAVRASSPGFRSTWDEFAWAMMCVQSRLFSGPYTGRSLQARLSVVGAVAAVAAVYVVAGLGTAEQGLNGFISALLFNLIYDTLLSKKLEWYAMLPLVDLANHRSDAASEVAYQYFTDEFTLEVGQAYKAGDEVHVQYGAKGNDMLLLYFGFCEDDNPSDTYTFADLPGRLGGHGAAVTEGRMQLLRDMGLADALTRASLSRAGFSEDTVRAVRVVLASDGALSEKGGVAVGAQGSAESERALRRVLVACCREELAGMAPQDKEERLLASTVKDALPDRAALALRFRRQKRTLLEAAVQIMDTKDKRSQ